METTPGSLPTESTSSAPGLAPGAALEPLASPLPRSIPYWHTALLLFVLIALSLINVKTGHGSSSGRSHINIYLVTMIYEWLLTLFVFWSIRRSGLKIRELIGGRWETIEDFLLDVAIGVGAWFGALILLAIAAQFIGMDHAGSLKDAQKQLGFLAPHSALEVSLWIALSATAGFCEELIFRGYFQRQFTRLLRNRWIALLAVSMFFGLGHAYEGAQRMVLIAILGFVLGFVSLTRRSLRPAMMAHTAQDVVSGLILRALR